MKIDLILEKILRIRPACAKVEMPETAEELIGVFDVATALPRCGEKAVFDWLLRGHRGRSERYGTYSTYRLTSSQESHSGEINKIPFAVFASTKEGNPKLSDSRLKSRKIVETNRDVEGILFYDPRWESWEDVCKSFSGEQL